MLCPRLLFHPFAVCLLLSSWLALAQTAQSVENMDFSAGAQAVDFLGLNQLIALSIHSHPSIATARAQYDAARFEVNAARAQYYPSPSVQVLQDKGDATSTILGLQQPLWAGGRLDAGLDAAQARHRAAQMQIVSAQDALALRVAAAWAAWMQARGRVQALEQGVALLDLYTESVVRRIQGGAAGSVDRELVAARLAQTQGDLGAARSAERTALARLAQLSGRPLRSQDIAISGSNGALDQAAGTIPERNAILAQALKRSGTLQRIEAEIEAARHETQQKRAGLWPTLSLRAQHQRNDSTAIGASASDNRIMLALDYTPGAGLSSSANIDAAVARVLAQQEGLVTARRELEDTVTNDFEDYLSSSERRHTLERALKASAEVLASYDRLFVTGKRSWLDVMNAARELIQAQTSLSDATAQQLAARARLRLHAGEIP